MITAILNRDSPEQEALILPFSSAMLSDINRYYSVLTEYREGNVENLIEYFLEACIKVFPAVDTALVRLSLLSEDFLKQVSPRKNSALERFLHNLPQNPVFDVHGAQKMLGISKTNNVYREMDKLVNCGLIEPVLTGKEKRSWYLPAVFDEIEAMQEEIGARQIFDD